MSPTKRRTILKGALASSAAIIGLGGIASSLPAPQESPPGRRNGGNEDDERPGRGGDQQNECEPPNELLAKFEWEGGRFAFEKPAGNGDLVRITAVETDEDNEPVAFCWTSDVPICFVSVKYGQEISTFPGDVYSGCVDLSGARFAISNVIFCVRPAQAVLCDDMDATPFASRMHLVADPDGSRDGVVQVISDAATRDYASGTLNVAFKQPGLTLADFADGGVAGDVSYDYRAGGTNTNALPDEVFFVLQTAAQRVAETDPSNPQPDSFDVAYRVSNQPTSGAWQSRDVDDELNGDLPADQVSARGWKVNTISSADIMTAMGIIMTAGSLRDSQPVDDSLIDYYSDPGTTRVLGVGFGYGYTKQAEVLDAYFDELVVAGTTYDFPVAVPLEVVGVSVGGGSTTVDLAFEQPELGVSVDDVVASSVNLTGLLRVAPTPPTTVQGATPASDVSVDTGAGTITATFPTTASGRFQVAGDFAPDLGRDQIVSFLAVGEVN